MKTTQNHQVVPETLHAIRRSKPSARGLLTAVGLLAACLGSGTLGAAENYQASLKAGDEHRTNKEYDQALGEYDAAVKLATSPTERGLALGKIGVIQVDQKNYGAARESAKEVLAISDARPVARVTALQVLADCQMKEDKDYPGAIETLEEALQLDGVAWAQPTVTIALGDCYRFSGKFEKALEMYRKMFDLPTANEGIKGIAALNMGLTYQYNLHDEDEAKASYKKAVELNPSLQKEVDGHLSRIP